MKLYVTHSDGKPYPEDAPHCWCAKDHSEAVWAYCADMCATPEQDGVQLVEYIPAEPALSAMRSAQASLAGMVDPKIISAIDLQGAYAGAVKAECALRAALLDVVTPLTPDPESEK